MNDARVPWLSGMAECLQCGGRWIAVWPLGADALECPGCKSADTDRNVASHTDEEPEGFMLLQ